MVESGLCAEGVPGPIDLDYTRVREVAGNDRAGRRTLALVERERGDECSEEDEAVDGNRK